MAITDKTRKTLWARSGNRCAICRAELVADKNEHDRNLNIGDECHIISEKPNGPRHDPRYEGCFDDYDNLILLCKNHHREVDELHEKYPVKYLVALKSKHESWIRSIIDNATTNTSSENPQVVYRIIKGKQLVDIIKDAHFYEFDHDELDTQEEVNLVGAFLPCFEEMRRQDLLQSMEDWGDVMSLTSFEKNREMQLAFDLNTDIKKLEESGFWVFGGRRESRMMAEGKKDLGMMDIATLYVLRHDNPGIIDLGKLKANM